MKRRHTSGCIQDPGEPERGEERALNGKGQGRVVLWFPPLALDVARLLLPVLGVRRCHPSLEYFRTLLVIIIIISLAFTGVDNDGGVVVVVVIIKMS